MAQRSLAPFIQEWLGFYSFMGGAAATLLGVLFVAVSLNSDLILAGDRPQSKLRAELAFRNYISVLLSAALVHLPNIPNQVLGLSLSVQSAALAMFALVRLPKVPIFGDSTFGRWHHVRRLIPSFIAYALLLRGGMWIYIRPNADGFDFIGLAIIILLMSATVTSWELLTKIAEIRHAMNRQLPPPIDQ
jgi:hypothetical protein